jgi:hypothetical protein
MFRENVTKGGTNAQGNHDAVTIVDDVNISLLYNERHSQDKIGSR